MKEPNRQHSNFRRSALAVTAFTAAIGSIFLWWRTSHVDQYGRIPQPNLGVNVPGFLLQGTALKNGLHCVCMSGYPTWKVGVQFERQTYISDPGYDRASSISFGGLRFVVLTHTLSETDAILSPFVAIVLPYSFLVAMSLFWTVFFLFSKMRFRPTTESLKSCGDGTVRVASKAPSDSG